MNDSDKFVRVGMAAIILKDGKVLLHKRKGKHASGFWAFAGGHLEFNEGFEEGIRMEIKEETDLNVGKIKGPVFVANNVYPNEEKHYITLFFTVEYLGGEAKVMEPEKCECWKWFEKKEMPENLMPPIVDLVKSDYDLFGEVR